MFRLLDISNWGEASMGLIWWRLLGPVSSFTAELWTCCWERGTIWRFWTDWGCSSQTWRRLTRTRPCPDPTGIMVIWILSDKDKESMKMKAARLDGSCFWTCWSTWRLKSNITSKCPAESSRWLWRTISGRGRGQRISYFWRLQKSCLEAQRRPLCSCKVFWLIMPKVYKIYKEFCLWL